MEFKSVWVVMDVAWITSSSRGYGRSVKYEKIFMEEFETVSELLSGLKDYCEFYNFE